MAPNKQKVVAPKQPGRKAARSRKSRPETPISGPTPSKVTLKLKLGSKPKPSAQKDGLLPVSAYQFPLSAPPSDDTPVDENAKDSTMLNSVEQGKRHGGRQRTKTQAPDMVFGSEMDRLMSSVTTGKTGDEDEVKIASSPPSILSMHAPERHSSLATETSFSADQSTVLPLSHYSGSIDEDVDDILSSLRNSYDIQVDLPDMSFNDVFKPYTARFLTQLYIQCYENHLWHSCDLIADTWIRALQKANKRSHRSKKARDHMWRKNAALLRIFSEKKKGFKKDVYEFELDVEDPDMDNDVTVFNVTFLQQLYDHTRPKCGARLLWADAMTLAGGKMEATVLKDPDVWPQELVYDIMCTALRMVGRKLTLKIEEKYEGAWCRYHEHVKHGLPCYRELAWQQKREEEEEEDDKRPGVNEARGEKRDHKALGHAGDVQGESKRVRFDAEEVIDFGEIDAEGESEEEG
ncbi:uncharacterized protein EKO05_0007031 [Ascochyta rabiei]|uniref:Uncharacterized protein n=1 Tax=Didymella rabiei TaxID=5454 RepID=A0A162YZZ8_DIDRA|nr:uncharacterized protein EKO05_0007031 [Ascochyta rabiei]KZM20324.1 hypothetical protein ST47_g8407 [Ascochyta rabiei]UPX16641.1 hypothetical protein EKO05_0007031 [Ascochyta rabiei]